MKNIVYIIICLLSCIKIQSQNLNIYINEALKSNPKIKAISLKYDKTSEKINEVNTLPNTQFGVGYFVSSPKTRTGPQRFKLSIKQQIPWFGTITARQNYTSALADIQYEDIVIEKRKLTLSVAQLYYKLYAIKAEQKVLSENITLLKTYETLALTSVEVGKTSVVSVLRLQIRENQLKEKKQVLQQEFLASQTAFNKLLNRNASVKVKVVDNLFLPKEEIFVSIDSLKVHPELLKYDKLYQSVKKLELLNQKEKAPKIGFGLDYMAVSKRTDINPINNGKDIFMPMISLSIPIFNKKYNSKTKQHKLMEMEINSQKENRLNILETKLNTALKLREASKIRYQTQLENLKKTKSAEKILIKTYETGIIDFNDVLDIQKLQLKFQMNQIKAVQNYYAQTAIINYINY